MYHSTLKDTCIFSGVGLHSGKKVRMICNPAPFKTGIYFTIGSNKIRVIPENIVESNLCSKISENGYSVLTLEHFMSVLRALNITDLEIELKANEFNPIEVELPILDGSAIEFLKKIKEIGIAHSDIPKERIYLNGIFSVKGDNNSFLFASPYMKDDVMYSYTIDFNNKFINNQTFYYTLGLNSFVSEIAQAKTFILREQIEKVKETGLGQGGDKTNVIIIGEDYPENDEFLTYLNEPVRHKILDMIGDSYLAGSVLMANLTGQKSSHRMVAQLLKLIFSDENNYTIGV